MPAAPQHPAIQHAANGSAVQWPASPGFFGHGVGQRLPETVQRKMESLFGARFDDVRIHVGPQAAAIGALAFTHGSDVYFAPGQYDPQIPRGHRLLGHELTHVVQQRAGRARNPFGSGVAVLQDPALEAEAERMGLRASIPQASPGPAAVQRHPVVSLHRPRPALQLKVHPLARGVIQRVRENDLQALSMLFTGYQRTGERSSAGEIQAMYIDSNVVVAANSDEDLEKAKGFLTSKKLTTSVAERVQAMHDAALKNYGKRRYSHYDFLFVDSSTSGGADRADAAELFIKTHLYESDDPLLSGLQGTQVASNASICAGLLDSARDQVIFLKSCEALHAEQQLLRVLAYRLRAGRPPTHLGLRGVRKPCSQCHAVLTAFSRAYRKVYDRALDHLGVGEGTSADKLDLKKDFSGAGDNDFGSFVEIYDELLKPSNYKFNLSGSMDVSRAVTTLRGHLSVGGLTRAKELLLAGYQADRPARFKVSRYDDEPVFFEALPGTEKDATLSELLTCLSVPHDPPPPRSVTVLSTVSDTGESSRGSGAMRRGGRGSNTRRPIVVDEPVRDVPVRQGNGQNGGLPWGWIGTGLTAVTVAAWYNWPTIASWLSMKEDPASRQPRSIPPPPIRWR